MIHSHIAAQLLFDPSFRQTIHRGNYNEEDKTTLNNLVNSLAQEHTSYVGVRCLETLFFKSRRRYKKLNNHRLETSALLPNLAVRSLENLTKEKVLSNFLAHLLSDLASTDYKSWYGILHTVRPILRAHFPSLQERYGESFIEMTFSTDVEFKRFQQLMKLNSQHFKPTFNPILQIDNTNKRIGFGGASQELSENLVAIVFEAESQFLDQLNSKEQSLYAAYRCYREMPLDILTSIYQNVEHLKFVLQNVSTEIEFKEFILLNPKIININNNNPSEVSSELWEVYTVRRPNWSQLYHLADQQEYGSMMHHTTYLASLYLQEESPEFDPLLNFLAYRRRLIATKQKHPRATLYGMPKRNKEDEQDTPLNRNYAEVIPRFRENSKHDSIIATIDGQPIILSKFLFSIGILQHTDIKETQIVMNYVKSTLFPEILKIDDADDLIESCGRLFWWICQAKPFILGDPSIAETLFRAIWLAKGLPNPRWKEGVIPWVEVSVEPDVDRFAKNFHTLFDRSNLT